MIKSIVFLSYTLLHAYIGAVSVKYFASEAHKKVAFIGTGVIATAMAQNTHVIHKFSSGFAYGLDTNQATSFANSLTKDLGYPVTVCKTAEEAVRQADVIFTQTPASAQVLKLEWLKPNATIIAR